MAKWTAGKLEKLGTQIELAELGNQTLHCGRVIPLPEVVLGTLGNVSIYQFMAQKRCIATPFSVIFEVPLINVVYGALEK